MQRSHIAPVYIYIYIYIRNSGTVASQRFSLGSIATYVHVLRVRNAELRKKRSIPGTGKRTLPQKRVR